MIEQASLRADLVDILVYLVCVHKLLLSMTSVQWGGGGVGEGGGGGRKRMFSSLHNLLSKWT